MIMLFEEFLGIDDARKKYLHKKVKVTTTDKGVFVGVLNYIGPNDIFGWGLQITIDRTPAKIKGIKDIELCPDEESVWDS